MDDEFTIVFLLHFFLLNSRWPNVTGIHGSKGWESQWQARLSVRGMWLGWWPGPSGQFVTLTGQSGPNTTSSQWFLYAFNLTPKGIKKGKFLAWL